MTLLELRVKELQGSGGWPEDIWHVTQDSDGRVNGYGCSEPYLNNKYWNSEGFIRYLFDDNRKTLSVDWGSSVINREQYEAAIAAQQPVWNGEGLPPVGCKCEYVGNDTSWGIVKVIGYDEDRVVFKPSGEDYYGITPGDKAFFRPIRTEADRKREKIAKSLIQFLDSKTDIDNVFRTSDVMGFIDYISSGQIPGVRLYDE